MSFLLRISTLFAILALLGAGAAEARGGRGGGSSGGGSSFRGGGSSFGRSAGSSFGRSASSSFGRASSSRPTFSRSTSSPARSNFSRSSTPSRSTFSSPFRRATPATTRSTTRSTTPRTTSAFSSRSTSRSAFTAPSGASTARTRSATTTTDPASAARSQAAMSRLRTWSSARGATAPTARVTASRGTTTRSLSGPSATSVRTRTRTGASTGVDSRTALRSRFGNQTTAIRSTTTRPTTTRSTATGTSGLTTRSTASRGVTGARSRGTTARSARSFGGVTTPPGGRDSAVRSGQGYRGATSVAGRAPSGTTAVRARSGRGDVRYGSSRGGVAYSAARSGSVRYSGHGGYVGWRGRAYYGWGGGYASGPRWCRPWGGGYYWGYPCGGWGWGVGIGIGVGLGYTMAYWDPWYYDCYGSYWVNGAPPFGFGTVSYGPTYNTYIVEGQYADEVVIPANPQIQPEGAAPAPAPAPGSDDAPDPEAAPGYTEFGLGVDAFLEGDYPGALQQFRVSVQADEENGEAWMAVAQSAFAVGVFDEAAEAITRAAELGAFPRGYRYDPSPMYPVAGRFDKFLARLETFREKYPDNADAQLVAAYFHVALGDKAKADAAISKVLELRPEDEAAPALTMALLPPVPPQKLPGAEQAPDAPAKQPAAAPAAE